MLIAKIYTNKRKIDEIHIQNIGLNEVDDNFYNYKIRKPENIDKIIVHNRKDGYKPLLVMALEEIDKNKGKVKRKTMAKMCECNYENGECDNCMIGRS